MEKVLFYVNRMRSVALWNRRCNRGWRTCRDTANSVWQGQ